MKVLYVVSEAFPFAKYGGLGEVAGEYPKAMAAQNVDVRVVMPLYQGISDVYREQMEFMISYPVNLALETAFCGLYKMEYEGVIWYFIENERCFGRDMLYGYPDDDMRFAFFSKAVCAMLRYLDWRPELIHCNDWQTALVPFYLRDYYAQNQSFRPIKTVFTIHNVEFQGDFSYETLTDVFGLSGILFAEGTLELDGNVNLMKGAIETADCLTTVSPTYARELTAPDAAGPLAEVILSHDIHGIRNGIPEDVGPDRSALVRFPYDQNSLAKKRDNKRFMQENRGLVVEESAAVFGCVSRLLPRKGMDLLAQAIPAFLERGCELVMTGDGQPEILEQMQALQARYPDRMAILPYTEENAAEIFAGADFLLMPSLEEPCGTAQMQAMRYGTVPVVRATGGLRDTVAPFDGDHPLGCGLVFDDYTAQALTEALERAENLYSDPEAMEGLRRRGMETDVSWRKPAEEYQRLYESLI